MNKKMKQWKEKVEETLRMMDPKRFVIKTAWDYGDEINPDAIDDFSREQALCSAHSFARMYGTPTHEEERCLILDLIKETGIVPPAIEDCDEDEYDEFIDDLVAEFVVEDYAEEELLRKTEIRINVFPRMDRFSELQYSIEGLAKKYLKNKNYRYFFVQHNGEKELEDRINSTTILHKLFESQGYEFDDLFNKKKISKSPFLESFVEEVENNPATGHAQLVALIKTDALTFINEMVESEKEIVIHPSKNLSLGFYNKNEGTGSFLEIVLEKDFVISLKDAEFQIEGRKHNEGYSVNETYGLTNQMWTENFEINKET